MPSDEVLLSGDLIEESDETANRLVLVDSSVHDSDEKLLAILGVVCKPMAATVRERYIPSVNQWLHRCRREYRSSHENSARWDYLWPSEFAMPSGWKLLAMLHGGPNATLTLQFLAILTSSIFLEGVEFGHSTTASYPKIKVPNPLPWYLLEHGSVKVGGKTVKLLALVARRYETALARIPVWHTLLPILPRLIEAASATSELEPEIINLWETLIDRQATPEALREDSLHDLWAGAAKDGVVPEMLRDETGDVALSQILVTGSPDLARRARNRSRIVITLDDQTLKMWLSKGARNLADLIEARWSEECGPSDLLTSVVPELADVLRDDVKETARCQPVLNLMLKIAETSEPVPCLMWENTLLLDSVALSRLSRANQLEPLLSEVGAAGWLQFSQAKALELLGDAKVDERRRIISDAATLPERLLLAVGRRREPLLAVLGDLSNRDFIQQCTSLQLAELCLAQEGPTILFVLKGTLTEEGLNPPQRWTINEARPFVASLGFPPEFAVSPTNRRPAEEHISGPIDLPELHDFQVEVFEGIRALVTSSTTRRRGVVSLPTGGGKTRVTVEAAVLLVLKPEIERRSVIWIAQTDELCEQAVQAFRQVWLNLGAQRTNLRIVRLWGSNPNPAHQDPGKPMVVVSSIQTMNSRMGIHGLDWLREPGLVVVDECHHAITPSYSNLLRWLDAEAPRPGAAIKNEPVIVGLSATPFRTDDDESERLARRFDSRWFPSGQEQLQVLLRAQGVLSEVDYHSLDSGVGISPVEEEALEALWSARDGLDFDRLIEQINQRLAGNQQRNERLAEFLKNVKERSILFFANSVSHSEEMSARLTLAGIPSAAVSGETPKVARRYFLEKFQEGEIRVLCNHSVLTTGFDAPKTDMVLISRQVFSPVRYMQMVGRGLRGEKNGGTARCRMVTVVDNLGRFQDRHPYHYCQKYFTM
jgi:superfamily II DNA or RNA helicase